LASVSPPTRAPAPVAEYSQPSPSGPTWSRSRAKTGSSIEYGNTSTEADAPDETTLRATPCFQIHSIPSRMFRHVDTVCGNGLGGGLRIAINPAIAARNDAAFP